MINISLPLTTFMVAFTIGLVGTSYTTFQLLCAPPLKKKKTVMCSKNSMYRELNHNFKINIHNL